MSPSHTKISPCQTCQAIVQYTVHLSTKAQLWLKGVHTGVPHPWFRRSWGAQAPPVFRILSHKDAIKPETLRF